MPPILSPDTPVPESIVSLMQREIPPEPSWIEPDILPKSGILIFGGESKAGKSQIMLSLARALALGENPLECPMFTVPSLAKVLIIEQELGPTGLQKRANLVYRDDVCVETLSDRLWYVSKCSKLQLNSPQGRAIMYELINYVRPNVLILDPIAKLHGYEENSNSDIGRLFQHFSSLIEAFKEDEMSIMFSHHFTKPPKDTRIAYDPLDPNNFRGARWFSDPDTVVTVDRLEDLKGKSWKAWKIQTRWKTRQGEEPNDMYFSVNREGDLRVRFEGMVEEGLKGV